MGLPFLVDDYNIWVFNNDYLKAQFCSSFQPKDVEDQPQGIPSNYISTYVDQLNCTVGNSGQTPETAVKSLNRLDFLQNVVLSFSFTNSLSLFHDNTGISQLTYQSIGPSMVPLALAKGVLPNGCNGIEFNVNTSGSLNVYTLSIGSGDIYSATFWISISSIKGYGVSIGHW